MELQEELFCEEGFDCYAWAEEALIERSGRVGDLVQLVPQLALLSQSLSKSIHATLHQLAVTAPQLQTQLDALQLATTPLQQQLDAVVAHVGGDDSVTTASWSTSHRKKEEERALEHLVTLHDAKQRLQACSQALVEAAKWEKNVRVCFTAVDEIATSSLLSGAVTTSAEDDLKADNDDASLPLADRVREMRKSLEVLGDLPGADDRRATFRSLCTQIEAKLTPALLTHLRETHLPVGKIQRCLEIFASVDKAEIVREEYCKCCPSHVHRFWYSYNPEDETESGGAFPTWLEGFYDEVLRMLHRESQHIREIFCKANSHTSVESVLVALLENTLASLRASFEDRLKRKFRMATLLRAFQLSSAFAVQVVQLFRSLEGNNSNSSNATSDSSFSLDTVGSSILSSVFDAYRPFFSEYARYASAALGDELLQLVPSFSPAAATQTMENGGDDTDEVFGDVGNGAEGSLEDFAQRFEDASKHVWALVDESMRQCYEFSAGVAFPEAVVAVTNAVQQFARALSNTIPSIRQFCNLVVANAEARNALAHAAAATPDWSKFHAALALLKACGSFESDLCAMEIRVRARVQEQLSSFVDGEHYADRQSSPPHGSRKKEKSSLSGSGGRSSSFADLLAADGNNPHVASVVVRSWLHDDAARNSQFLQFAHEYHRSNAAFDASTLSRAVVRVVQFPVFT